MHTKQPQNNYQISQFHTYTHKSKRNTSNNKTTQQTVNQDQYTMSGNRNYCLCQVQPFEQEINNSKLFQCLHCEENLEKVSQLKKVNIILEYNNAKLQQQLDHLKTQNQNLKQKLHQKITTTLPLTLTSTITQKQDLQSQLFQCKLINQLLMIGQYPQFNDEIRKKIQDAILEKLILQEQLEQKTRIISDTVLYPVYHYDGRVKFLRDCVLGLGRLLFRECKRMEEMRKGLRKEVDMLRSTMKAEIQAMYAKFTIVNDEKQNKNNQNTVTAYKITEALTEPQRKQKLIHKDTPMSTNLEQRPSKTSTKQKSKTKPKKDKSKKPQSYETKQQKFMRPCCKIVKHLL